MKNQGSHLESKTRKIKLKVCGMGSPENILQVAALQPEYLGFIFFEKSPRNFSGSIPEISSAIKKTGVFVNSDLKFIQDKVSMYDFSAIQLHGEESASFCRELKEKLPAVELIKVFSIKDEFDFGLLSQYEKVVDFFLFDTLGKAKGGNGYTFNWEILRNYPSLTPFFLSGGIGVDEIEKVHELQQYLEGQGKSHLLYAIDVNSKVETAPGKKNIELLTLIPPLLQDSKDNV